MFDPTGNSQSNSISNLDFDNLTEEQQGQVRAALTVAIKGKLIMTAPCPKCGLAKRLHEKIYLDGTIRHECKSCGYFMIWHDRAPLDTKGGNNVWLKQQQETLRQGPFTRGIYGD